MAHATEIFSAHAGIVDRLFATVATWKEAQAKRGLYRETVRELNELSTRELNDLGIARSEISSIARKAAYGA